MLFLDEFTEFRRDAVEGPRRLVLLQVDQQLTEGPRLRVPPELTDPVGPIEVGETEYVQELGACRRAERIETFSDSAFELIGSHGRRLQPSNRRRVYGLALAVANHGPEQVENSSANSESADNQRGKEQISGQCPSTPGASRMPAGDIYGHDDRGDANC